MSKKSCKCKCPTTSRKGKVLTFPLYRVSCFDCKWKQTGYQYYGLERLANDHREETGHRVSEVTQIN